MISSIMFLNKMDEEMIQWLRTGTALSEDPS